MTTERLTEIDGLDTDHLLAEILVRVRENKRVCFLCAPGQGGTVMQRLRVALSRTRQSRKRKGKPLAHFTLRNTVHPETHESKRFDCVVVWREVNQRHTMLETLEDLLGRRVG